MNVSPREPSWPHNRGRVYMSKGDYKHAIRDFLQAIKINTNGDTTLTIHVRKNLCEVRALAGQFAAALKDCNEAIRLASGSEAEASALATRGFVYLKMARFHAATTEYDEGLKREPKFPFALYGRGIAKLGMGDSNGGNADLRAARELLPEADKIFAEFRLFP